MDATLIAAIASAGGVAITALVTAIILAGKAEKPWSLLADERGRRAKAEADRDIAREHEQRLATLSADKDRIIDAQLQEIARLQAASRPAPGHGTDELRRQAAAEDAERARAGADLGGDPSTPVPRVTTPGHGPGGSLLPR